MIEFWGVPQESSNEVISTDKWKECRDKCYEENSCVAVLQLEAVKNCRIYRFGQLSQVEIVDSSSTGKRISIKKNFDKCPATLEYMLEYIGSNETYSSDTLAYDYIMDLYRVSGQKFWNINVKYFIECPEGSYISVRGETRVCITLRLFPDSSPCQNKTMGANLCAQPGDLGLTGPYSMDEGNSFKARGFSNCPNTANCNYWIDGYRTNTSYVTINDTTLDGTNGYNFNKPINTWEPENNCLYLATKGSAGGSVWIVQCWSISAYNYCLRGAMCRTDPVYDY